MKKLAAIALALLFVTPLLAQVEMGKTKQTIMGKGKLLGVKQQEMILDNFGINIILYNFAEDQGGNAAKGNMAQVGVRANLVEVDEAMAQEIVNEAYAYFVEQWKSRGVTVVSPTKEELEATKKFSKAKSKGKKADIISGGTWDNQGKKHHDMWAWPEGTNIASSGSGPLAANGNFSHFMLEKGDAGYTSFSSTINFIKFKTAKLGTVASVKSFPGLFCVNTMTANVWQKNKLGGYLGSNESKGIEDFFTEINDDDMGVNLGAVSSKLVMKNYVADKEKFKANVIEMLKKGMDDMFTDYDLQVEKNS